MTNQRINNTEIWSKRKLLYQTAADLFIGFFLKKPTCIVYICKHFHCLPSPGSLKYRNLRKNSYIPFLLEQISSFSMFSATYFMLNSMLSNRTQPPIEIIGERRIPADRKKWYDLPIASDARHLASMYD